MCVLPQVSQSEEEMGVGFEVGNLQISNTIFLRIDGYFLHFKAMNVSYRRLSGLEIPKRKIKKG